MPLSCNWCIEEFFLNFGTTSSETSGSPCRIDGVLNVKQILLISMERNDANFLFNDRNLDLNFFSFFFSAIYLRLSIDVDRNNHNFYFVRFDSCFSNYEINIIFLQPIYWLPVLDCAESFFGYKKYGFIFAGHRSAWRFFERKWIFKSETHLIQLPHGRQIRRVRMLMILFVIAMNPFKWPFAAAAISRAGEKIR